MKRIFALLLAVLSLVLFSSCAKRPESTDNGGPGGEPAGEKAEITLTKENFDEAIAGGTPILVDFWASWCGPCMRLAPTVEEIAKASDGSYRVGKVNVDEQPELAARYDVTAIPRLIVFKNGGIVDEHLGLTDRETIMKMLDGAK